MKVNVDKDTVIKIVGGVFTVGAAVFGLIGDKKKDDKIAEKAAKIVMEQSNKSN